MTKFIKIGKFREDNFQKSLQTLATAPEKKKGGPRGGRGKPASGASDCFKIVKMIMERNYQPVIVFAFSKKECEGLALQIAKLDFNTAEEEKALVESIFMNAIDTLSGIYLISVTPTFHFILRSANFY